MSKHSCQLSHELIIQVHRWPTRTFELTAKISVDCSKMTHLYYTFWFQLNWNNKTVCPHLAFNFMTITKCNLLSPNWHDWLRIVELSLNSRLLSNNKYIYMFWLVACYRRFDTGLKKKAAWLNVVGVFFFLNSKCWISIIYLNERRIGSNIRLRLKINS